MKALKQIIGGTLLAAAIALNSCSDSRENKSEYSAPKETRSSSSVKPAEIIDKSPLICSVESGKFDTNAPNVSAKITDIHGNAYSFSQTYTEQPEQRVTLEKDSIFYLIDFDNIKEISYLVNRYVQVSLRGGNKLAGEWVPNDRPLNFYQDSGNIPQEGYIFGIAGNQPSKIRIKDISSLIFQQESTTNEFGRISDEQNLSPKRIILQNGSVIDTQKGYIADFCGHWWSSTVHQRLEYECGATPLKDIGEIVFTGEFDPSDSQCRKIIIKYKNGLEKSDSLNLTSESYGGTCNNSSRFRDFDKFFAAQNGYNILIPLDDVKKVIPLSK